MPAHRWQAGQPSPNPSGRPRGAAGLAAYIREQTNDLRELADIALDMVRNKSKVVSERDRANALTILLNRALGRAEQTIVVHEGDARPSVDLSKLSSEELAQWERLLLKSRGTPILDVPSEEKPSEK